LVAAAVLASAVGTASPARAAYLEDAGWGALTVLTNVFYMPAKLAYSALGGLTGGLALALTGGDLRTAETVWVSAMGGTYVVTPRMLQGQDPIEFAGSPFGETTADAGTAPGFSEQQLGGS
jgi:hypothetical protein